MKNMKLCNNVLLPLIGILYFSFFFSSCNDDIANEKMKEDYILTDIVFNVTNPLPLLVGTDSLISYTLLPDYATKTDLMWETMDESIATVDENGRIFTHKAGKVDITARSMAGFVAVSTLKVEVVNEIIKMESIDITSATGELSLYVTATLALNTRVTPEATTYPSVKWISETPEIATVSEQGIVTGIKEGTAVIRVTATDGSNVTATVQIEVKPIIAIEDIIIEEEDRYLAKGETSKLTVKVLPSNATETALRWSSADPTVVEIAEDGLFTAKKYGETILTVKTDDFEKNIQVIVIEGKINDTFVYGNGGWTGYDPKGTLSVKDGKLVVPMNNPWGPYRAEIDKPKTDFHAGNYPILAARVKIKETADLSGYKYNLSIWGGAQKAGLYGQADNMMKMIVMPDGSIVYYADISEDGPGFKDTKKGLPAQLLTFEHLIYTFKDVTFTAEDIAAGNTYYEVDWIKSFRSEEAFKAFVETDKLNK